MKYIYTALLSVLFFNTFAQNIISDSTAILSAELYNLTTDKIDYNYHSNYRLCPASLTKLVTTSAALEILGPEYSFITLIGYTGTVVGGILKGNVVIKGNGDPTLGSLNFIKTQPSYVIKYILKELQKSGIYAIDGVITVDCQKTEYNSKRLWEDMGNYYGATPQGFNWRDNTVTITLKSEAVDSLCSIKNISPPITPYTLKCKVYGAKSKADNAYVYGINEAQNWWILGSIPANRKSFKIKAAMPLPAQTFIDELRDYLISEGLKINNKIYYNNDFKLICKYSSPKLKQIIKVINQQSNNFYADALLFELGKYKYAQMSWDAGLMAIYNFWNDKINFSDNAKIFDGSGLSPKNIISANGFVNILKWMNNNSAYYNIFEQSLARGGIDGTLYWVFRNPKVKGKIIGKSGSINGVQAFAGYLTSNSGHKKAFCVIANNFICKKSIIRNELDNLISNWVKE